MLVSHDLNLLYLCESIKNFERTESVGRSYEEIINEKLNTENNEREKVVPKERERKTWIGW